MDDNSSIGAKDDDDDDDDDDGSEDRMDTNGCGDPEKLKAFNVSLLCLKKCTTSSFYNTHNVSLLLLEYLFLQHSSTKILINIFKHRLDIVFYPNYGAGSAM